MDDDAGIVDSLGFSALDQFLGEFTGDSSIKASSISAALSAKDRSHARNGNTVIDADMLYGGRYMDDDDGDEAENGSIEANDNDDEEDAEDEEDADGMSDEDDDEDEHDGVGDDDDEEDDDYREAADAPPVKKRSTTGGKNDGGTSGRKSKQSHKRRQSGSLNVSAGSSKKRGRKTKADNWEDEIDRELDEEDRLAATSSGLSLPMSGLPPIMPAARTRMRGEEDDFDGDGDGDVHMSTATNTNAVRSGGFSLALPSMAAPASVGMFGLPPPSEAGNPSAWRLPPTTSLPGAVPGLVGAVQDEDEEELTELDKRDLARQQALIQAARWRQQQVEQQAETDAPAIGAGDYRSSMIDAQSLYPSFAPGKILDFTALFTPRPRKRARIDPSTELYPLPEASEYATAPSTRDFRALKPIAPPTAINQILHEAKVRDLEETDISKGTDVKNAYQELVKIANTTGWQIPTDLDDSIAHVVYGNWDEEIHLHTPESALQQKEPKQSRFTYRNPEVLAGDWMRSVIFSNNSNYEDFTRLQLSLDDAHGPASIPAPQKPPKLKPSIMVNNSSTLDSYNLSNDKLYEVRREQKRTVRQTFGHIEVQHSYPAMKLQFPWYKTQLSKNELRSFHRLPIQFPTNIPLSFAKVRSAKRKKDKTGRKLKKDSIGAEAFRTMGDLSLRDTGNFVLWEYSEENPPIIANVGMGSIIVNYYRKTDVGDMYIPKTDLGEPVLLNPSDESPFLRFGQVEPGQMIPALYNNLIRAPLFRHRPYDTDFLAIKTTVDGETKFFVRDIANMFVVGQTYPLTEVPGPQARKLTATAKHRLQSITYKLVSKNPKKRVKIGKLLKYFPDQSEPQMRQRLKDFMEFNRAGDNQGFWKIKAGKMPDEDDLFKLIGPEQIVLSESTQVGQRNLLDAGFTTTVDEDKGKDNEESTLDIRQQLAPWFTTKNFINATQNKAMLKLHGEGDPSSRGEGFSFLRVSMKDIFLRAGEKMEDRVAEIEARPKSAHRYNVAEQQGIYRQEIDRIWKTQYESLSSLYEPMVTEADELRFREEELKMENAQDLALSALVAEEGMSPNMSRDDSPMFGAQGKATQRVLRIRRLVNGVWRSEIVRDAGVIRGYLRHKQTADADDDQEPESLVFNGDPEHDAVIRKKLALQLEKLRKNQERRLQRKNAKMGITGDVFLPGGKKVKHETTRRCGNCGQIGHMKTNRKCPKWSANQSAEPGANEGASVANPFAVGLPGLGQA